MKKILEVKNVCFSYYKKPLCLKDVNFSMNKNDRLCLLALDDMGKTTFLNVVSGFDDRYFGSILLNQKELKKIPDEEKNFSIIYEKPVLLNSTINDNIDFLCKTINKSVSVEEKNEYLKLFNLNFELKTKVKKLSFFDKIKLCLIRIFIKQPTVLFIDNIFKNLSFDEKNEFFDIIDSNFNDLTIIFALNEKLVDKNFDIINRIKPKQILYLTYSKVFNYNSFDDFEKTNIDLNVSMFSEKYKKVFKKIFFDGKNYFVVNEDESRCKLDKKYNDKLKKLMLDFEEDADVVFEFCIDESFDFNKDSDINTGLNNGRLFLFSSLDCSRII